MKDKSPALAGLFFVLSELRPDLTNSGGANNGGASGGGDASHNTCGVANPSGVGASPGGASVLAPA